MKFEVFLPCTDDGDILAIIVGKGFRVVGGV